MAVTSDPPVTDTTAVRPKAPPQINAQPIEPAQGRFDGGKHFTGALHMHRGDAGRIGNRHRS